jgi:hypothetical protein
MYDALKLQDSNAPKLPQEVRTGGEKSTIWYSYPIIDSI